MDIEKAHEIATTLFTSDPRLGTYSIDVEHHVEHRNRSLADTLALLPEPLDWLAPVDATDAGATAYILAKGFVAKVEADFGIKGDDNAPPAFMVQSALLTARSSVRLVHSRLSSKRHREWTFDVGLDSPIELQVDLSGDTISPPAESFAQAVAGEIGWATGRNTRPAEPLIGHGSR